MLLGTALMDAFGVRLAVAVAVATMIAVRGRRKRSLSPSGAVAGWLVGFTSLGLGGYSFGVVVMAMYISSSLLTKYGAKRKAKIEHDYHKASERTAANVGACVCGFERWCDL